MGGEGKADKERTEPVFGSVSGRGGSNEDGGDGLLASPAFGTLP